MNSRQRVLAILNREPTDRIPVDIWYTPEVRSELLAHAGTDDELELYRRLGIDKIVWFEPLYKGPMRQPRGESEVTDHWGRVMIRFRAGRAVYNEFKEFPLRQYDTPEALDDYPWWPDPEKFDYEAMAALVEKAGGEFVTMGPWVSLFENYCWMRGLEQSLMDLVLNPGFVQAALDRIEGIQTELLRHQLGGAAGRTDLVMVSDDMGDQRNLMISIDTWKEFLGPRLKRWCELIHSYGVRVLYHSDGAVEPLIPHLIAAGVDVLNPIQHACRGMELAGLKEKYGKRLIFHGGVDNQTVLPGGSPDDVRREVRLCLETLGRGGGYVCCSCHNVQAGTPLENVLALIGAVHEEGHLWLR